MVPQAPRREAQAHNWEFFLSLPEVDPSKLNLNSVKDSQLLQPLFEFSGACAGCGETPYLKLLSQLFGDRALIANAMRIGTPISDFISSPFRKISDD